MSLLLISALVCAGVAVRLALGELAGSRRAGHASLARAAAYG